MRYSPATRPTFYFIGVTTGQSSIMKVFPVWAEYLELGDVEIKGVDLSQAQSDETVRQMRDLWLEHKVAVFRDQALEDEDLIRFAEYFGPTYVYVRDQFNDRQRPVITLSLIHI